MGFAKNYQKIIADPLQEFCSKDLDINAVVTGLLSPFETVGGKIARAYDERLFKGALIQDLPSSKGIPEFIFYATNYDTGSAKGLGAARQRTTACLSMRFSEFAHWCTVAGFATRLWRLEKHTPPVLPLAGQRRLGSLAGKARNRT